MGVGVSGAVILLLLLLGVGLAVYLASSGGVGGHKGGGCGHVENERLRRRWGRAARRRDDH